MRPDQNQNRRQWPRWVRLGLWGVPTRRSALIWVWVSALIGVFLSVSLEAFAFPVGISVGIPFFLAALWYWVALRWVDQHETWY
jgi:hypothetical protein